MGKLKFVPFRLEHLWCLTVIAGVFMFVNTHPIRPNDFWWHLKVGKEILETQTIPGVDEFSFTMYGEPYPSYSMFWLMEVFLYTVYNLGGPALSVFIQSMIITLAYAIIIYISYVTTGNWRIAAIGGIFAVSLGLNDWNVRPQSIAFLLGSICLMAIYSYRKKPDWRYLLLLPASILIWVNSHGTFLIGLAVIGIWSIDELINYFRMKSNIQNKSPILGARTALFTSSLIIFVNPRGIGIFDYLLTMGRNNAVQNIVIEWAPPTIQSLHGGLFYAALLLCTLIIIISPKKPTFFEMGTCVVFAILGISTSRGIIWFGLITSPIFTQHLNSIITKSRDNDNATNFQGSNLMNIIIGVFLLFLVILSLPWLKERLPLPPAKAGLISSETPLIATEFLIRENTPVQVFHAMSFGSYLIWAAQPTYKVFVDSRIELYPPYIWRDYYAISNAEIGWDLLLADYGVNTLMLSPTDQKLLVSEVSNSESWVAVYRDDVAEIFTRRDRDLIYVQRGSRILVC